MTAKEAARLLGKRPPKAVSPAAKAAAKWKREALERRFMVALLARGLGGESIVPQYQFDSDRKFRFDFAAPTYLLGIEIDGGIWIGGRHSRGGKSFIKDHQKMNLAAERGWRVLRATPEMIDEVADTLKRMIGRTR